MRNLATIILFVLLTASAATAQLAPEHNISQPMPKDSEITFNVKSSTMKKDTAKVESKPLATEEDYKKVLDAIVSTRPSVIKRIDVEEWRLSRILIDLGYSPSAFGLSADTSDFEP